MPSSQKVMQYQKQILKAMTRKIVKKLAYNSTMSYSADGSVYIHSCYKTNTYKVSKKIVTRISYHPLQVKYFPELDIIFTDNFSQQEFMDICILRIHDKIRELEEDGEQKS